MEQKNEETKTKTRIRKVLKYKDLIQRSEKEIEKEDLLYNVEQAELNVRGTISKTKKALSKAKKELSVLLRETPFDYKAYSDLEEDIEAYKRGIEKAELFLKKMF